MRPSNGWRPGAALLTILKPEIYLMVVFVYGAILIPIAVGMGFLSLWLDWRLGLPEFLPGPPFNIVLFGFFTGAGLALVWWCYSYLMLVGNGGPAPLVARRTSDLVTTGPYALVRHPSVWGKLMGVIGLGCLIRSPVFLFGFVPLLLTGSLIEKYFNAEPRCIRAFGEQYQSYQRRTPFFIPGRRRL